MTFAGLWPWRSHDGCLDQWQTRLCAPFCGQWREPGRVPDLWPPAGALLVGVREEPPSQPAPQEVRRETAPAGGRQNTGSSWTLSFRARETSLHTLWGRQSAQRLPAWLLQRLLPKSSHCKFQWGTFLSLSVKINGCKAEVSNSFCLISNGTLRILGS